MYYHQKELLYVNYVKKYLYMYCIWSCIDSNGNFKKETHTVIETFFCNLVYHTSCIREIFSMFSIVRGWIIKLLFILSVDARPHRSSQTTRRRTCPCLRMRRRPQPAESSSLTMDTGLWLVKKVKEELMNGWKNIINLPTCISLQFYARYRFNK